MDTQVLTAIIGLVGIVTGILLNEFLFQKRKQSMFSDVIFKKKLKIYSRLLNMFRDACKKTRNTALNSRIKTFDKETIVRNEIVTIIEFAESEPLYIDIKLVLMIIEPLLLVSVNRHRFLKEENDFSINQFKVIEEFKNELGVNRINFFFKKLNQKRSLSQLIKLKTVYKNFINL